MGRLDRCLDAFDDFIDVAFAVVQVFGGIAAFILFSPFLAIMALAYLLAAPIAVPLWLYRRWR